MPGIPSLRPVLRSKLWTRTSLKCAGATTCQLFLTPLPLKGECLDSELGAWGEGPATFLVLPCALLLRLLLWTGRHTLRPFLGTKIHPAHVQSVATRMHKWSYFEFERALHVSGTTGRANNAARTIKICLNPRTRGTSRDHPTQSPKLESRRQHYKPKPER